MSPLSLHRPVRSVLRLARESLYLSVGTGVLAVQAAQVRRRELEAALGQRFGAGDEGAPAARS
jgi:hypothetical protein